MQLAICSIVAVALLQGAYSSPLFNLRDQQHRPNSETATAAYFLDNDPAGNTIVSLRVLPQDGTLSNPVRTVTGGDGLWGLNASGVPVAADTLFSQGSVVVSGNFLFTVNAGSNTVSMFNIPRDDPQHPQLIGKPAPTLGDVPMSVTYSASLRVACVLNGGANPGVTCFGVDRNRGLTPLDQTTRSLNQAIHQNTPPTGPGGTASQIIFSPTSDAVIAIIKGNAGTTPPTPGFFYTYPVVRRVVSANAVITSIPDIPMNFGSVFVSRDRLFMSDPTYGASLLDVSSSFSLLEEKHILIPNLTASCWAAYAPELNTAYAVDAALPRIAAVDARTGSVRGFITYDPSARWGFDTAVRGTKMYVLASSAAIVVIDLQQGANGAQQQLVDLSSLGRRQGWMGMAIY